MKIPPQNNHLHFFNGTLDHRKCPLFYGISRLKNPRKEKLGISPAMRISRMSFRQFMKIQGGAIIAKTKIRSRKIAKGNICTLARRLSVWLARLRRGLLP
jgi:hypothetical protein